MELIIGIGIIALLVQRILHNRKVRRILDSTRR